MFIALPGTRAIFDQVAVGGLLHRQREAETGARFFWSHVPLKVMLIVCCVF